ncbi:MAG TPA: Ku protein [Thermoleophilaceae bacterium]|nr:Ku protein [Thermoleophilaceae bacterium]
MPRSIWTGAISFGLGTVPIRLVSAVRRQDLHFHQLHAEDGARVQHRRFCSGEDREVPREEIVHGYELEGGRCVVVTDEELERLAPERTHTIDIERFVDLAEIGPIDSSYYATPNGEIAAKPYDLLRRAMASSGKVAIGRVVIRTKEHLAAIRAVGEGLTVAIMLFPGEVARREELEAPAARGEVTEREVVAGPEPERPQPAPDPMAALEASLAGGRDRGHGARARVSGDRESGDRTAGWSSRARA